MPVPSNISELSTTPANNSPAGTETPGTADDYLRTHAAFIATLSAADSAHVAASDPHPAYALEADVSATLAKYAPKASPALTGTPTAPTAAAGTNTAQLATTAFVQKAFTDPVITGCIKEDVYTITDGAAFEIDPGNGSVQLVTLGASRTPKATNFLDGESVTLMVLDGSAYTLTWTDTTFGTSGVVWVGGVTPSLHTTKYTIIQFWKVGTQVYGISPGAA